MNKDYYFLAIVKIGIALIIIVLMAILEHLFLYGITIGNLADDPAV